MDASNRGCGRCCRPERTRIGDGPGAVFVFVAGGEIAIARGFGAAQLEPRRPVDPDLTRFRLASVSKAITATAALQLVEQGRLDLHANVNTYLRGFEVGDRGPITVHHLLTHTAGFDERLIGIAARSADEVQPLPAEGEWSGHHSDRPYRTGTGLSGANPAGFQQ
jgi:CubicO group peptidase (beta-lactamase class C family)